jgi:L-asparaginase
MSTTPPPIRIVVTGGTFDKDYDELRGTLDFRATHVPQMLALGRCRVPVEVRPVRMMDSLDMTDEDRAAIAHECATGEADRVVVTHGTDTMVETAAVVARRLAGSGRTVVFTGAMIPFAFGSSDGLFNLGSAISFAQALAPGVYIAMNGRCFAWNDCRKNRELGVFEPLAPSS